MCWRKDLNSVQKRMLAVMNNNIPDIPHDVVFVVGEEKVKISCHKIFLAIVSPVFETMFSRRHNTKEKETTGMEIVSSSSTNECISVSKNSKTVTNKKFNKITVSDVHPEGLKNVIKYAYIGVISVDLKDIIATMYASHKYDIPDLTQHCTELLNSNLSVNNVVTIYQASTILNEVKLKEKAWEFIKENAGALLDSEELVEFSEENLLTFLSLNEFPDLKSEADVFKAVLRWGNFQCDYKGLHQTKENLRTVLKNSYPLIRFPAMEADEFDEIVEPSGLLKSKECIQMFKYFLASGEKRILIGKTLPYSSESRTVSREYGKCLFCTAIITDELKIQPASNTPYDYFTFSGNTDVIKLKSVGIVLSQNFTPTGTGKSVSVCLHDFSLSQWIHTATTMVSKPLEICYIDFANPVSLKSNVKYCFTVNFANGAKVPNPVQVVSYSQELMKTPTVTYNFSNMQQLVINCSPGAYVIWALQFEN